MISKNNYSGLKKMLNSVMLISFLIMSAFSVFSQGVAINATGAAAHSSALLDLSSTSQGVLVPRMTKTQKLSITSPATGLMIYQTDDTTGFWYFNGAAWLQPGASTSAASSHYLGELYGEGIIFYLDNTGNHGLIASLADNSASSAWSNVLNTLIGPSAQSEYDGQGNTTAIINQSGHTSSAAQVCDSYSVNGVTDWYLPSIGELERLFFARPYINETLGINAVSFTDAYWSSTELNAASAWPRSANYGYTGSRTKDFTFKVRCLRKF